MPCVSCNVRDGCSIIKSSEVSRRRIQYRASMITRATSATNPTEPNTLANIRLLQDMKVRGCINIWYVNHKSGTCGSLRQKNGWPAAHGSELCPQQRRLYQSTWQPAHCDRQYGVKRGPNESPFPATYAESTALVWSCTVLRDLNEETSVIREPELAAVCDGERRPTITWDWFHIN